MSGYRDCVCCGACYLYGDDDDKTQRDVGPWSSESRCEVCTYSHCGEEGDSPSCVEYIVDGAAEVYIPQSFARNYLACDAGRCWRNVSPEDREILEAGPEHEHYWDVWDTVESEAEFRKVTPEGIVEHWALEQDGDLFARLVSVDPYEIKKGEG